MDRKLLTAYGICMANSDPRESPMQRTGKGVGREARSLPTRAVLKAYQDDRPCLLTWLCHPVERGGNSALNTTTGYQRQMEHVISGDVFRLWSANFSADKEPNSQRGGLKILKTRKSQVERINEAERAYCLVPTINDKLSHSSSSVGKGGRQEKVGGEAAKAEGVPTGCPWFSSKSLVHANTSVKVLQIINRCCTWGRRKKKNQANYQAHM